MSELNWTGLNGWKSNAYDMVMSDCKSSAYMHRITGGDGFAKAVTAASILGYLNTTIQEDVDIVRREACSCRYFRYKVPGT